MKSPSLKSPVIADLRTLWHLARGAPSHAKSHAERLERFYRPQAKSYDAFRERLLQGRRELIEQLQPPAGGLVVELGAGTGRNAGFFEARLQQFGALELVDLCPALLEQARRRWQGTSVIRVIEADATTYQPSRPADCVYFSYALTMIPQWREALANALCMLKPGGLLGVVDFGLPRGNCLSARCACEFWKRWFAHDGVHLDHAHVDTLQQITATVVLHESTTRLPYLPALQMPYYYFIGRKPAETGHAT